MKIFSANKGLRVLFYSLILASLPISALARAHASPTGKAYFQQILSGTISDATGPLPGAIVLVKGTTRSVAADSQGKYTIAAVTGDVLLFSFTGYKNLEVIVTAQSVIDVSLEEDSTQLKELTINAGYYSVKQKEATGSIARITSKDIETQPVTNMLAAMQGRMAGVSITQSTGVPGGGFSIKIRGTNSLRQDGNDPLYIIDGMPFNAAAYGASNTGLILPGSGTNPLNSLNPSDIESIEVLKDADATAIYGSRGANGVVLITTKKGKGGKTAFSIESYTGFGTITKKSRLMKTPQYIAMRKQAFYNDGVTEYPAYAYDINGTWDQNRYTDWQKELIGGPSVINSLQSTISGGNEQTQFLISNTIYGETTVFPGDFDFRKVAMNFNLNHTSRDKRFRLSFSGNYITDRNNLPATDLTKAALTLSPNAPELYDSSGGLNWENSTWSNPVAVLNEPYENKNNTLIGNTALQYLLADGLELKTALGFTQNRFKESRATPSTIYDPAFGLGTEYSSLSLSSVDARSWNFEPQLNYKKQLGQSTVQALAGMTFLERKSTQEGLIAQGYSSNSLIYNPAMASMVFALPTNDVEYRYNAVFARLNYDYAGRYILNLTGRRDGSSRFGPGKKFANFGAVGAAWIFSKENWFDRLPALSFGKLRASYGTTGNDQIGDYQFLNLYGYSGNSYNGIPGLQPVRLFNPDFSWETNKKLEAAIEIGLFQDRVFVSSAWYRNRSSDQLVGIPLPGTTGFSSIQSNLDAVVQNSGWEFELRLQPVQKKHFGWNANLNVSLPKTKLLSFPGLESSTYRNQYIIGEPLDIIQAYNYEGVDTETGLYRFTDFDGDGTITANGDRKAVVRRNPKYFAGLQNSLRFKNWNLDFLLQFVDQMGTKSAHIGYLPGSVSNLPVQNGSVWTQPGDVASVQKYATGLDNAATTAFYRFLASNGSYTDASYLRLKNVSLSYMLPASFSESVASKVYVQAQNLFTITSYKNADPETQFSGYLPPLRIVSFGMKLTF
ncbi:SusC/RagA family TonB-linked outer membrane protein [Flavobacterium sp. AG291]|uniref:SusC/RagA family TonB-linked outer membrane protein n=1 Tax=Flavobacterium sp. AG291 TaxID=2184000 RepID=UPI000E0AA2C6|nr:SusC/RagA family TonB-linked outer membrane protein [Flavobacterium sp. AG291]RDI11245.1 TonB-linked SusC/RagA family outer membrane protein [Flavobacterium sp. AG291]